MFLFRQLVCADWSEFADEGIQQRVSTASSIALSTACNDAMGWGSYENHPFGPWKHRERESSESSEGRLLLWDSYFQFCRIHGRKLSGWILLGVHLRWWCFLLRDVSFPFTIWSSGLKFFGCRHGKEIFKERNEKIELSHAHRCFGVDILKRKKD